MDYLASVMVVDNNEGAAATSGGDDKIWAATPDEDDLFTALEILASSPSPPRARAVAGFVLAATWWVESSGATFGQAVVDALLGLVSHDEGRQGAPCDVVSMAHVNPKKNFVVAATALLAASKTTRRVSSSQMVLELIFRANDLSREECLHFQQCARKLSQPASESLFLARALALSQTAPEQQEAVSRLLELYSEVPQAGLEVIAVDSRIVKTWKCAEDGDDDEVLESADGGDDEESRKRTAAIAESFKAPMLAAAIASVQLQMHPDLKMSDAALAAMAELLCHFFERTLLSALPILKWGRISAECFIEVVHSALKQTLGKHCLKEMEKAMAKDDAALITTTNYGLQFPVKLWAVPCLALVGTFAPKAAIALAAALEYLTAEVLELGGNEAKRASLLTIEVDQMEKAIVGDEELDALFHDQIRRLNANSASPEILDIRLTERLNSRKRYFRRDDDTVVAAVENSQCLQDATDACCDGWIAFVQQLMNDSSTEHDGRWAPRGPRAFLARGEQVGL